MTVAIKPETLEMCETLQILTGNVSDKIRRLS